MFKNQEGSIVSVVPPEEERCPFLVEQGDQCQVSRGGVTVSWRRNSAHCRSGDYDACNRFLARVLQCSQSRSTQGTWALRQK
jgi:hypothetical protein